MPTVYTEVPDAEKVFHDLWALTSVSRHDTAAVRLGDTGEVIEVQVDYQGDRVTAYVLDDDGDALPENEVDTVPFDPDLNADVRAERALEAISEDIVRFWKGDS